MASHGKIVSSCTSDKENTDYKSNKTRIPCDGVIYEDDSTEGGCHEPCRFMMGKVGEGNPPFLDGEGFLREVQFLMKRCRI
jgi:hypothetical protein